MSVVEHTLAMAALCVVLTGCAGEERPPLPPVAPSYEQCDSDRCDGQIWRRSDETISI